MLFLTITKEHCTKTRLKEHASCDPCVSHVDAMWELPINALMNFEPSPLSLVPVAKRKSLELVHFGVGLSALGSSLGQDLIHHLPHIPHLGTHLLPHAACLLSVAQRFVHLCQLVCCVGLQSTKPTSSMLCTLPFASWGAVLAINRLYSVYPAQCLVHL